MPAKLLIEEARKSISKQGHKDNAPALWFDVIGSDKKEGQKESKNDERKKSELKLMKTHPMGLCWIIFMNLICPVNIGVYNLFLMVIKTSFGHQIIDKSLLVTNFGAKCVRSWRFLIQCICKLVMPRLVLILVVLTLVLVLLV